MKLPNILQSLVHYLIKHKERTVVSGVVLAFLFFIGSGLLLHKLSEKEEEPVKPKTTVKLEVTAEKSAAGKKKVKETFSLLPSPDMLLAKIDEMQNLRPDVAETKLAHLRVLWPLYFFEIRSPEGEEGGSPVALFDVRSDGFGVMVQCDWDATRFPELEGMARGRRIWVGGEILGVSQRGTGMVLLKMEYLNLSKDIPAALKKKKTVNTDKQQPKM